MFRIYYSIFIFEAHMVLYAMFNGIKLLMNIQTLSTGPISLQKLEVRSPRAMFANKL